MKDKKPTEMIEKMTTPTEGTVYLQYQWWKDTLTLVDEKGNWDTYQLTTGPAGAPAKVREIMDRIDGKRITGYGVKPSLARLAEYAERVGIDTMDWRFDNVEDERDTLDADVLTMVWDAIDTFLAQERSWDDLEMETQIHRHLRMRETVEA